MIVRYAGIMLATGYRPEDTWANGGMPSGEQDIQTSKPTRKAWVKLFPRGHRMNVIPVTIITPPAIDIGTSFVNALLYFAALPQSGLLEFIQEGYGVSYPDAALKSYKPSHTGLSNSYDLVFHAGEPSALTPVRYALDEENQPYEDEEGNYYEL